MTSQHEIDEMLRLTLEDHRLSRGERRALEATLSRWNADEQQLALLRSRAFAIARDELVGPTGHGVLDWLEEVTKALIPKQATSTSEETTAHFTPGNDCLNAIVGQFRRARNSADVCVFTITDDRITSAILDAVSRRVNVRIITDNDKASDLGSDIQRLSSAGIAIRVDRTEYHMHHKFAVFDRRVTLTGSYNWTRGAAEYNEENLIVTDNRQLTQQYNETFEKLWQKLA